MAGRGEMKSEWQKKNTNALEEVGHEIASDPLVSKQQLQKQQQQKQTHSSAEESMEACEEEKCKLHVDTKVGLTRLQQIRPPNRTHKVGNRQATHTRMQPGC